MSGLLALKQRWPEVFRDVCLYAEVCRLLGDYTYSVASRGFLHEIFNDIPFREVSGALFLDPDKSN